MAMRLVVLALVLSLCTTSSPPIVAAELAHVDRSIGKEPAYQSTPAFCLLVFGLKAEERVWLALDGDALYVDRNGNGDLTEADERVKPQPSPFGDLLGLFGRRRPSTKTFEVGPVTGGGRRRHRLVVQVQEGVWSVYVEVDGRLQQFGGARPGASRDTAPVIHFNGPLEMQLAYFTYSPPAAGKEGYPGGAQYVLAARVGSTGRWSSTSPGTGAVPRCPRACTPSPPSNCPAKAREESPPS
jgi:hypothetical protein